jgi:hypothetical protein
MIVNVEFEGVVEGIRCAICMNSMKGEHGCDGSCEVDSYTYGKVLEVIMNNMMKGCDNHDGKLSSK